jgi:TolA-binding protein
MLFRQTGVLMAWFTLVLSSTLSAQEPKLDPAATRDYAVAAGLQNKQLYSQAIQRWQKFIETYPTDPRLASAHNHLGACQLQDRKYTNAVATFRAVLAKYPQFESRDATQFNLALALYNIGLDSKKIDDLRAASLAFGEVPTKYVKSKHIPAALYYQGECLYQAGNLAEAAGVYQKVITGYPTSDLLPDVYFALGTTQQELGKDAEAIATFRASLQKYPNDRQASDCRLRLAQSLFKQKNYAEAAPLFGQAAAVADFPDADFALMQQAHCLYEQKQIEQAAGLYETLVKKFPRSKHVALGNLSAGKCWYQAGKYAQAQTALALVDAKSAEASESAYWLGQALVKLNRPADAIVALDKALAASPQGPLVPRLTFARASALSEIPERRKEAMTVCAEFARKYPQHEFAPRALYLAALAALKLDDQVTARTQAEAFLADAKLARHELAPDVLFVAAESNLQAAKPDLARAESLYRRLVAEYPRHAQAAQARLRVGLCLVLAKKHAEATTYLTQSATELKEPAQLAEVYLLLGRAHQDAGRLADAVTALQKALTVKPDWTRGDEVMLALAQALRTQKKSPDAIEQLRKLTVAYPKSVHRAEALYQLGEIAYEQSKYDEAALHYQQAADHDPRSPTAPLALYGAGVVWFAKKSNAKTVETLTKLLTAHAASDVAPRAHYLRGLAYQRLKQLDPAVKDLEAFLASQPPQSEVLEARYALALCQAGLNRHEQAAETLATLLKEKPDYPRADQAYYELAFALLAAKKEKEASAAFRKLATDRPESPLAAEAWFRVGEYHEGVKEAAEALQAFTAGLAKAKTPALREKLQYKLGWVQFNLGQFREATTTLQTQLREHPKGELAQDSTYLAGECLFKQNKYADALPLLEQISQVKGSKYQTRSLYRAAACQAGLKQWPASQKTYETLIEQFPNFELIQEARYGVGFALQNQDKLDDARAMYERITKAVNTETAAKSRFMIGEIAFRQKNHKEAVVHFLEAALGYPYEEWQALGYFEAGRCFIEMKEPKKALETLETLVKKYPNHARAKDAESLIKDLKK